MNNRKARKRFSPNLAKCFGPKLRSIFVRRICGTTSSQPSLQNHNLGFCKTTTLGSKCYQFADLAGSTRGTRIHHAPDYRSSEWVTKRKFLRRLTILLRTFRELAPRPIAVHESNIQRIRAWFMFLRRICAGTWIALIVADSAHYCFVAPANEH